MQSSDHQILDTAFVLHATQSRSRFFDRMDQVYEGACERASTSIDIHVHETDTAELDQSVTDWGRWGHFHRSLNYAHWDLKGPLDPTGIYLPGEGMLFRFDAQASRLDVYAAAGHSPRSDELVFHAARNLALAHRSPRLHPMLHASAVDIDGAAWLFLGTKGAGKSTLFIDSVLRRGATPLANDRVLLDRHAGRSVWSWPSYLS